MLVVTPVTFIDSNPHCIQDNVIHGMGRLACDLIQHSEERPVSCQVYIIEANPRASRTVPFVAKAVGHPLATYASLLMAGQTLKDLNFTEEPTLNHVAVKEAVLPFEKFQGAASNSTSTWSLHAWTGYGAIYIVHVFLSPCANLVQRLCIAAMPDGCPCGGCGRDLGKTLPDADIEAHVQVPTHCWALRCARQARSWASTRPMPRRTRRQPSQPGRSCRPQGRSS